MPHQVTIRPTNQTIEVNDDETVLAAAMRHGIVIPYGCRNGACGSCKGKLLEGEIDYGKYAAHILPDYEKRAGFALFCQAKPRSDLIIEARVINVDGQPEMKKLPCRVQKMERVAEDVIIMTLSLPANERLQFRAGQYLEIILRDGKRRAYSMANAPFGESSLELHIRAMPGGVFTEYAFNRMKEKDILRFEGPMGTFFLREDSDKPIVLLASGTGFAPIKSLIEEALHNGVQRQMVLYWGGRKRADLYRMEMAQQWQAQHDNFSFIPVLSDSPESEAWQGRTGFVHRAVMQDFPSLAGYQVYACGAPVMVDAARKDFTLQCALPEEEFFCDSFTPAAGAV